MKKIIVLGGGRIGSLIAEDLATDTELEVTVADASRDALHKLARIERLRTTEVDLADPAKVEELVGDYDLVVGALPCILGGHALQAVIEAGKSYSDVSFMPEDPLQFDELAKNRGVTAIVDCGVAPGLSNMIVGHTTSVLDALERVLILVGGLPTIRTWPYEYKLVFSPHTLLEEYTRPTRYIAHGDQVTMPALSELELVELPGIGTLEAFNTDGLRTLLSTTRAPFMQEKTLRYPGHAEKMRVLRETGFFDRQPIEVCGVKVRPIDVTARLLFPKLRFEKVDEDITVMRVVVDGHKGSERLRYIYDMLDRYDRETSTASMARTTGFPCAIMAKMLVHGEFEHLGICPPEYVGRDTTTFQKVLGELERRDVRFDCTVEELKS